MTCGSPWGPRRDLNQGQICSDFSVEMDPQARQARESPEEAVRGAYASKGEGLA